MCRMGPHEVWLDKMVPLCALVGLQNPLPPSLLPDITDASWISALPILRTIGFFFFFPEDRCVNSIGISKNKGSGDAEIGQRCHTGLNPCCYQELLFTRKFTRNDIFFVACSMPLGCDVCVCAGT